MKKYTSLLKGGYLPSPGVAFAEAETISTSTRCTYIVLSKYISQHALNKITEEQNN